MEIVTTIAAVMAARILWSSLTAGTARPSTTKVVGYIETEPYRARKKARYR